MRRLLFASVLSLTALLFLAPVQLRADGTSLDTFVFSENLGGALGQLTLTWQLPAQLSISDPTLYSSGVGFQVQNVPATVTVSGDSVDLPGGDSFDFFADGSGFGGQFLDELSLTLAEVSQLYNGPENNPTFIAGTYGGFDPTYGNAAVLTITTPEPSSILMYFVGFLALAGVLAVRKVQG